MTTRRRNRGLRSQVDRAMIEIDTDKLQDDPEALKTFKDNV
jgi:hypothetical protein